MIKLSGNVSRKVPIPGTEFSSQSYGAGMEVEVGNNASPEEIRNKFKEMYQVLEVSVKEQIVSNGAPVSEGFSEKNTSDKDAITPNQKKLIEKLVREQGIFGKERIRILGVKTKEEAKTIIKNLLSNGSRRQGEE